MTRKMLFVTWYDPEEAGFESAGLKHRCWDCLIEHPGDLEKAKNKVLEELITSGIKSCSMKILDV